MSPEISEQQTTYNGQEAYAFLKSLNLKIGKTKVYNDISNGILPCASDKRVWHDDLLAYAESLKAPTLANACDTRLQELKKVKGLITTLAKELLTNFVPGDELGQKLAKWLKEAESFADDRSLNSLQELAQEALRRCVELEEVVSKEKELEEPPVPDFLFGIACGIVVRNKMIVEDATFLRNWCNQHANELPSSARKLKASLNKILSQGVFTTHGGKAAYEAVRNFVFFVSGELPQAPGLVPVDRKGNQAPQRFKPAELKPTDADSPLLDIPDIIDFTAAFCFTGIFAYGSREECEQAALQAGGQVKRTPVSQQRCYVVVGTTANPDWYTENYGSKVETAVYNRQRGCDTFIIHESVWRDALERLAAARPQPSSMSL